MLTPNIAIYALPRRTNATGSPMPRSRPVLVGGNLQVLRFSYTLAHGITPGVIDVEIAPQNVPVPDTVNIVISDGERSVAFYDCKKAMMTARRGAAGLTWNISFLDRRWQYQFTSIYGEYNRRDDKNDPLTPGGSKNILGEKKTPRELLTMLLQRLGERNHYIDPVPDDYFPHVEWIGANAAEELATLCDLLGLRVVLCVDNVVRLLRMGQGSELPNSDYITEASLIADPPEMPGRFEAVGAPLRAQTRLDLEAVGLDNDDKVKRIDELNYKPSAGWGKTNDRFGDITNKRDRKLAQETVWKWYRAKVSGLTIRPFPAPVATPSALADILPLSNELVEYELSDETGEVSKKHARVYGIYEQIIVNPANAGDSSKTNEYEYPGSFQLDERRGIVMFHDPVRRVVDGAFAAGEMKLECSFTPRHWTTGHFGVWSYGEGNESSPLVEVVRDESLIYEVFEDFDNGQDAATAGNSLGWTEVKSVNDLSRQSQYVIHGARQKYNIPPGTEASYVGFHSFSPDGAILQVTWDLSGGVPMTRASRGVETARLLPYSRRRHDEIFRSFTSRQDILSFRRVLNRIRKSNAMIAHKLGGPIP